MDHAFIDGTFYKDGELSGRSMKEVPHPFVSESMSLFDSLPPKEKSKIIFIHFNHTNPLNWDVPARRSVQEKGYDYAVDEMVIGL